MALIKNKYALTFVLYGVAFAFKLQSIFLAPFFVVVYCVKRKFSILNFLYIVVSMVMCSLPNLLVGRSIKEIYSIYNTQARQYYLLQMNYPSFWAILTKSGEASDYFAYKTMAILLTVAILGFWAVVIWKSKIELNDKNTISIAFLLVYTCVLFLPTMHERYGFCYEILAIVILFYVKKTFVPMLLLMFLSCSTYGKYLFGSQTDVGILAVINVGVYFVYCYLLWRDVMENEEKRKIE